jgi:YfiH family protein
MNDKIKFNLLEEYPNLKYDVSQVADGNMSFVWGNHDQVFQNRQQFFKNNKLQTENGVIMSVVHGTDIVIANQSHLGAGMDSQSTALKVDALMTNQPNITLSLLTADCLPIILYDPKHHAVALAHLGWHGTDLKFAQKIARTMTEAYQTNPKDLIVAIAPGVHPESYIFPRPLQQEANPDWQPYLHQLPSNQISINIVSYNQAQLTSAGIPTENIEISPVDTATDPDFFSHYRSVKTGEPEGRFLTIVTLLSE